MTFKLNPLPYSYDALQPFMSKETLEFHHDKHHQTYVTNLNGLIENTKFENLSLEDIVKESYNQTDFTAIFNNAAQHLNHIEFWESMQLGTSASQKVIDEISKNFSSMDEFRTKIITAGLKVFGSGWVWLAKDDSGKLEIISSPNAVNPVALGKQIILGCDVWEHSYYIDYRNARAKFLEAWFDNLINWNYVEKKLS